MPCYQTGMSQTLERILEEVKALSEDERRQLAAILRGTNGSTPASLAEREFEHKLAAEGWLSLPQPAPPEILSPELTSPFLVRGRSCSEILIEERR
jgi:hypothetical protein